MKIPKLKIEKIKDFFKKLPLALAEKAFLSFLGLFLLGSIFGGFIFYKYSVLANKAEPQTVETQLQFREKTYQEILKIWQEKEERTETAESKEYKNPFK